jgi:hypothetical protein
MASNYNDNNQKAGRISFPKSAFNYNGRSTGNYRVCGASGLFVIPPQVGLSLATMLITGGPIMFQILYNNKNYIENQKTYFQKQWAENNGLGEDFDASLVDMSEFKSSTDFIYINLVLILLCFLSFATLLAAGMTDPGIIPRQYDNKNGE